MFVRRERKRPDRLVLVSTLADGENAGPHARPVEIRPERAWEISLMVRYGFRRFRAECTLNQK